MPQYHFGSGALFAAPEGPDTEATTPAQVGALQGVTVSFDGTLRGLHSRSGSWPIAIGAGRKPIRCKAEFAQFSHALLAATLSGESTTGSKRVIRDEPATVTAGAATASQAGVLGDLGVIDAATGRQLERVAAPASAWEYSTDDAGAWSFHASAEGRAVLLSYLHTSALGFSVVVGGRQIGFTPRFKAVLYGTFQGEEITLELAQCVLYRLGTPLKRDGWTFAGMDFAAIVEPFVFTPTIFGPVTSWTYPLDVVEALSFAAAISGGSLRDFVIEPPELDISAALQDSTLINALLSFDAGLDALDIAANMTGGEILDLLRAFTADPEALDISGLIPSGTLVTVLVENTADPEGVDIASAITGGTLS